MEYRPGQRAQNLLDEQTGGLEREAYFPTQPTPSGQNQAAYVEPISTSTVIQVPTERDQEPKKNERIIEVIRKFKKRNISASSDVP